MKISCTNTMVPGGTLTEKAQNLRRCGFDGISVFEEITDWTPRKEEELLTLEARTGVHVCEFCFSGADYGQLMNPDPAVAARSKAIYRRAIEVCNQLGAVSEMEYQYAPRTPVPLLDPYLKMEREEQKRFQAIYAELAGELEGSALLLLEPINRYESPYLNCIEDNAEIVEEVGLPGTGLLFDTFHMSIEQADLCAAFERFAPLIRHVHLGDNNRLLPGKGCLPWKKMFATMGKAGYNGYVNLECAILGDRVLDQLEEEAAFLKSFV